MNLGNESETVEFKKSTGEHKEALQAICAILNKHGCGEVYFGVKDNGDVIGREASDATVRQVASWISGKIEPAIFPTIERCEVAGGIAYIRVEFSGLDAPYSADGRYFTRVGTSNKVMTASELQAAMINRAYRGMPWDAMSSGRPISDVGEKAVRDFIELGKEAGRINGEFKDAPDALSRLDMIASDGALTNAAVVMFCYAPIAYPRIKLGLLAGNSKLDILDLRQECLPLIQLLKHAEFFVVSNIRRRFVFGEPGMRRLEIPEIPREAIREAIANALCHRDYTTGTSVEVNVYMDFVEIVSPGLFPSGDSPEKHLNGTSRGFKQRNPNIAQALFRSGLIEQYGTGIPRIKEDCEEAGVKFDYRQTEYDTIVRFERPGARVAAVDDTTKNGNLAAETASMPEALNDAEQIAMGIAHDVGSVTRRELMEKAGVGRTKATKTLRELTEKGLLVWVGRNEKDPFQHYQPAKNERL